MIKTIKTNDLKKGAKVVLRGTQWNATIMDNKKGNVRMAEVQGIFTEMGSIYMHDIGYAIIDNEKYLIELTEDQKKMKAMFG